MYHKKGLKGFLSRRHN